MTKSAIDLLKKMLDKDPVKRPSASDCLNHPFFKGSEKDGKEIVADHDPALEEMHAAEIGKLKDK